MAETMLPLGVRLALSAPWWSWDSRLVRKALWASVLVRLRRLGAERLKANGASGRFPAEWRDLEFLRREARTQRRVFDGDTNLCPELLLGYASLLGVSTADCFPDTPTWIAEATVYLAAYAPERVRPVCAADARVYAEHVVPVVASRPASERCVQAQVGRMPAPVRPVVLAVASSIGPVLEAHDPEGHGSGQGGVKR